MKISNVCAILAVAGIAVSAAAQDSVSNLGTGLPGDSPDAFDVNDQVDRYVVDLVPFTTSWGTEFGINLLHKSPDVDGDAGMFFGSLTSAQAISQNAIDSTLSGTYAFWTTAGQGVTDRNAAPGDITVTDIDTWQQATLFGAFAGLSNSINGAIINVDNADSSRLYVTRVLAAHNQDEITQSDDTYSSGVGGVDASGNAYFRMDNFGAGVGSVSGSNYVRVRLADRNPASFNQISGPGITADDAAAVDALLVGAATHRVPQAMPAEQFGGNGLIVGTGGTATIAYGGAMPLTNTTAHLTAAGAPSGIDHRGGIAYTPNTFSGFANPGVGTLAITGSGGTPDPSSRKTVNVWAVDSTGAVIPGSRRLFANTGGNSVTDPCDGFTFTSFTELTGVHHSSQAGFNGGSGQVDVQVLPNGDLAGVITLTDGDNDSGFDQAVVAFTETPGGVRTEQLVAYTTFGPGKAILDGPGGNVIGNLYAQDAAFGAVGGPSITSPAFDAAGNIWFVAPFGLNAEPGIFDTGLFRAVRNGNCWELELVVRAGFGTGTKVVGANSNTAFELNFITINDSNSIASGAFFSSNVSAESALGQDISMLPASDPRTNGGVILAAEVVYDVDGDGDHDDPSSAAGDPLSIDESYTGLLYIGALTSKAPANSCIADFDNDGDVDLGDFGVFGGAFGSVTGDANYNPAADFDGDGDVDLGDFGVFGGEFGRLDCLG
ncbi:MAG: hypothetical protein Tsb0013_15570 [Phycisphaerales bacterium]